MAPPAPPHHYNPNVQTIPNPLADNKQNLNLNRPPSMPTHGLRPPAFGQSPPLSRPGPPPSMPLRPVFSPQVSQPPVLTPNLAVGRPGPVVPHVCQPPPFGLGPLASVSFPSSMGVPVMPSAARSSSPPIPQSSISVPPPVAHPSGLVSAPPLTSGSFAPAPSTQGGPVSNGPSMFGAGALPSGPRFPHASNNLQPPYMQPPLSMPARAPPQASILQPVPCVSPVPAPKSPPVQPLTTLPVAPQARLPVPASPYGIQTWPVQPQQVAPSPSIPGSGQPPRIYSMPPVPSQSTTTTAPPMAQPVSPLAGPSKIDPSQIPRPGPSMATEYETRQGNQANLLPPGTSDYTVRDTGNCSPRYMRCTINQIPCTVDLLSTSRMQLALMVQPLALPHPSEEPIEVVDFGESGPVRCSRCKGYINPFVKFTDQGRHFICNFCGHTDETPRDYHCNLGPDGRRRDADERPELCKGTVEFVAPKRYMVRDPMPAVYFFLIDVSMNAIQTGATAAACSAIKQVISDLPEGSQTFAGVATFDCSIHFYNLKRALQQPLMLIVPDVHDIYIPLETDVLVPLSACRPHLELLLESIPTMFQESKTADSAFGAAVKAAFLAMKSSGGKLLAFQSVLPSIGVGALSSREVVGRANVAAAEKVVQKSLQAADTNLKTTAIEFAEYQVCIDLFLTAQDYVDIASLSVFPRTTGGQVYYYYPFSALSDSAKLYNDLKWNIIRPQGFEAVMRVRCSEGVQVQDYYGNFCKRVPTDIDFPAIDCDKAIMVTLKHDGKLQDGAECAFQCALLYTTVYGQRRIRVSTLSLPCTNRLSNLFRSADLDAQFSCLLKQVASEIPSKPLLQVQNLVTNACINTLLCYRKFCASVTSLGQLILPEALKLLPLYSLALIKSTGLQANGRIEDRSNWITRVSSLSTPLAMPLVYPRMVAVHDLGSNDNGGSPIPPPIPLSSENVSEEGVYFLENGEDSLIYVGESVNPDILHQLFGASSVDEIPTQSMLQQRDNRLSKMFNDMVNEIRRQRCCYLRLKLCKKGNPSGMLFLSYMVEDTNLNGLSYVEYLVQVHRQIQNMMS